MTDDRRGWSDPAYVAVVPPKAPAPGLAEKAAALLGRSAIDLKLLLAGEMPRIVGRFADPGDAERAAGGLREAGLAAFVCRDSGIRRGAPAFPVHSAVPGADVVLFQDRAGGETRLGSAEAFLIIRGRMKSRLREDVSTTRLKLNVAATVLTGGIPVVRRVTKSAPSESSEAEDFLRVYACRSADPRLEMFQNRLDYAFLGPERKPSSAANFGLLAAKIRDWFPGAIVDERMLRSYHPDIPASGADEVLEIGCRLVYFQHKAAAERGAAG